MKNTLPLTRTFVIGIIISSLLILPYILDLTLIPRFISFSACLIAAVYFLYRSGWSFKVHLDNILLLYLAYCLFCCLSFFWSKNKAESLFEISKQLLGLFAFLFTYFSLKQNREYFITALLQFSVVLSVISFLAGCYQLPSIMHFDKESLYLISGLNGHKNLYSSFLFINLFFLINAFLKLPKPWKTAAIICIALDLATILFLRTKAVAVGLAFVLVASAILYAYRYYRHILKFRLNIYVVLLIAALIANVFFLRLLPPLIHSGIGYTDQITESDKIAISVKTEKERLVLWDKTYHVFKKAPILGVGCGNWQIHFPDATLSGLWRAEDLNYTFQRPHNDLLWILSETGLIGFNLYLLFALLVLLFLVKILKDTHRATETILCLAFTGGYFMIAFFDFPKERIEHGIWLSILLAVSYDLIRQQHSFNSLMSIKTNKRIYAFTLALLLFIFWIGLLRFKGEFNTRRMFDAKNSGQVARVIERGNSALSFAYNIDPTSVPIHWYTGNAHATLGDYKKAQDDFIKAYKFNPYNRNVVNDLASSYVFENNSGLAKKYYEEAARISPRFDDPKLNLAALYINEKNYAMASHWLSLIMHDSERRTNYQKIIELHNKTH